MDTKKKTLTFVQGTTLTTFIKRIKGIVSQEAVVLCSVGRDVKHKRLISSTELIKKIGPKMIQKQMF